MITEQLKALVRQEADNLKIHATAEELSKLNFDYLAGYSPFRCIYGQMTGDCETKRAVELLNLCAVPYSQNGNDYGETLHKTFNRGGCVMDYPFSPIEFYICQPEAKNSNLIAYLKGETENLEL